MKFEIETEVKIDTNSGDEKEKKVKLSLSDLKKMAMETAGILHKKAVDFSENIAEKTEVAVANLVLGAIDLTEITLAVIANVAEDIAVKADNASDSIEDFVNEKFEFEYEEEGDEDEEDEEDGCDDDEEDDGCDNDEDEVPNCDDESEIVKPSPEPGKKYSLSEYFELLGIYSNHSGKVDTSKAAERFFTEIDYPKSQISISAFKVLPLVKKITYANVAKELFKEYSSLGLNSVEEIIDYLKNDFKTWVSLNKDIQEYCPNANLRQLMVYFAKK